MYKRGVDWFREGFLARKDEKPIKSNPCPPGTRSYKEWAVGWSARAVIDARNSKIERIRNGKS